MKLPLPLIGALPLITGVVVLGLASCAHAGSRAEELHAPYQQINPVCLSYWKMLNRKNYNVANDMSAAFTFCSDEAMMQYAQGWQNCIKTAWTRDLPYSVCDETH